MLSSGTMSFWIAAALQVSAPLEVWDGTQPVAAGQTLGAFKGDAVASNGRIRIVARPQDAALDLLSPGTGSPISRARLMLVSNDGERVAKLDRVALTEHSKAVVCLEVAGKTARGVSVAAKFRIKRGDVAVESEPLEGAARLRVECPARLLVLPDFFADDILVDARAVPLEATELPTDNFLLALGGTGDAIVASIFENREQEVRVALEGSGGGRRFAASEIAYGKKGKIWIAVMEGAGIWHARDLKKEEAGAIVPLGWKRPFAAQWRVDFSGSTGLFDSLGRVPITDSWELLEEQPGGKYLKPSWLGSAEERLGPDRMRSGQPYACWVDLEGDGYVQPLKLGPRRFVGPAALYPIHRTAATPPDAVTFVDVVRNALGVGPCEYILDLEGQKAEKKGEATCGVRYWLNEIYGAGEQKKRRDEIVKAIDGGLAFVTHIRGRITSYVELARGIRAYLAEQAKAHPDLKEPIAELETIAQEILTRVAAVEEKMKTPEHMARMNENFKKNVLDYAGPDLKDRVHAYAEALVEIGEHQDSTVMTCRWAAKSLRQRAGMMMVTNPAMAPVAEEVRRRTQEVLRAPATYEKARN
jgi:hypothetical protein